MKTTFKLVLSFLLIINFSFAKTYVLIVGISKYKNIDEELWLNFADKDADSFKNFIEKSISDADITILKNEEATKRNIIQSLKNIKNKIKKGDKFIFFFSGHGVEVIGCFTGALVPYDYNPDNKINSLIISRRDLRNYFEEIDKKVSYGLLIIDSCFSQFATRGMNLVSKYRPKSLESIEYKCVADTKYPYKNLISLTSSFKNIQSNENPNLKHGVYTYYFLKGLGYSPEEDKLICPEADLISNKDGKITIIEFTKYISYLENEIFFPSPGIEPMFEEKDNEVLWEYNQKLCKQNEPNKTKDKEKSTEDKEKFTDEKQLNKIFLGKGIDKSIIPTDFTVVDREIEADIVLKKEKNKYLVIFAKNSLIGKSNGNGYNSVKDLKNYLKAIRLFLISGKIDYNRLKVSFKNNENREIKYLKVGENGNVEIKTDGNGYIFLFSIGKRGDIYLLEPSYIDISNNNNLQKIKNLSFPIKAEKPTGIELIVGIYISDRNLAKQIANTLKYGLEKDELSIYTVYKLIKLLEGYNNVYIYRNFLISYE